MFRVYFLSISKNFGILEILAWCFEHGKYYWKQPSKFISGWNSIPPKNVFSNCLPQEGASEFSKCYFGGTRLFLSLKMISPWPPREGKFLFLGAAESFETWLAEAVTLMPLWRSLSLGWKTPFSNNFDALNPVETSSPCWTAPFISRSCNLNKKRLQYRCFPVNIAKFLRAIIWRNIGERLLPKDVLKIFAKFVRK